MSEQGEVLPIRNTYARRLVLEQLLEAAGETYGVKITQAVGLKSGTVGPILAALERAGWVADRPEEIDPSAAGRPPRHYYWLTEAGRRAAEELLRGTAPAGHNVRPRPQGNRETSGSLADIRRARGLTQEALAAQMRVSQSRVSRIEHSGDSLELSMLYDYGKALGACIEVRFVFDEETFMLPAADQEGDDRDDSVSEAAPPNR